MAKIEPVLVVKDVPAGLDPGSIPTGTITFFSGGTTILGGGTVLSAPPATPTPTASTTIINGIQRMVVTRSLGKPEEMSYQVNGPTVSLLAPGLPPGVCRIIGFSINGGTKMLARMLSGGSQVVDDFPPYVDESGAKGLGDVLATTPVDRFTAQQISFNDFFNGKLNAIKTSSGDIVAPGNILPELEGIGFIPVGLPGGQQASFLSFTYVLDAAVSKLLLDVDVNRDYMLNVITTATERLGSIVDPQQAQVVIDSGDYGINGGSRTVTIGHKGAEPVFTFDGVSTDPTTPQPLLKGRQGQAQTIDMLAAVSFTGGSSKHGLPDSGKITCSETLNHQLIDATGNYRSGMLITGIYTNRDQGGIGYWPGDGSMHWMSQAMGVTCLWYDQIEAFGPENNPTLYAGTERGVYTLIADPAAYTTATPWTRVGGAMALSVLKLVKDRGTLYALVEFQQTGQRHIIQHPAASGAATGNGLGDWSSVASVAGISDFSVCNGHYYALSSNFPAAIVRQKIGDVADPSYLYLSSDHINGAVPTGLDVITDNGDGCTVVGTYVRASSGAKDLAWIAGSGSTLLSAGAGLKDKFGFPVMVNEVSVHPAGELQFTTGTVLVALFASTNQGVFVCANLAGNAWKRTSGQNNLGDINVLRTVSAPPRQWHQAWTSKTRLLQRVYALTESEIYLSPNGTVNWIPLVSKPLDAGPAFFALWKQRNGVYPDNTSTALFYPDAAKGPYRLNRAINGLGDFYYVLENLNSQAPAGRFRYAPLPQLSVPALIPEAVASQLLVDGMVRILAYTAKPQTIVIVDSIADDDTDLLFGLQPTQQVRVNGPVEQCIGGMGDLTYTEYRNVVMYVLSHTITIDAARDPRVATTSTRLGSLLLDDRSSPEKWAADLWYQYSRLAQYNLAGH